jgi:alpha-N-arabinofuranosidase
VLTVAHPGALWLNLVSLFPPTYNDRVNGNRIDLMENRRRCQLSGNKIVK